MENNTIPFKAIECGDRALIQSFTLPSSLQNCDLAFANMCSWRFLYDSEYAIVDNLLLIRFWIEDKRRIAYMMPIGSGDLKRGIELLDEDSRRHGHPLCMLGITPESKARLEELFPDTFHYIPERDFFDYIYLREDLATLKGKKLQPKRNHINKFTKTYTYEYVPITPDLVEACLELENQWFQTYQANQEEEDPSNELRSVTFALQHLEELGLTGGAIRVDGKVIAFSIGSPINHQTFGVHAEKADTRYEGAYTIMNREFAARIPEQYIYVNREEDLGIPGLRKAKLSYNPTILLEKSAAMKRR